MTKSATADATTEIRSTLTHSKLVPQVLHLLRAVMFMLHVQRHRIAKYNLTRTGLSAATGTYLVYMDAF